ncbi:hypothetical protein VNO77_15360 [Canavalia gladiata]|uniref:Uncharacterized protein n=1 Tax=Canavalia gladiata TaxID=3824 RepID=A0AAN9M3X4_CANGL
MKKQDQMDKQIGEFNIVDKLGAYIYLIGKSQAYKPLSSEERLKPNIALLYLQESTTGGKMEQKQESEEKSQGHPMGHVTTYKRRIDIDSLTMGSEWNFLFQLPYPGATTLGRKFYANVFVKGFGLP